MTDSRTNDTMENIRKEIEARLEELLPSHDQNPSSLHEAMRYAVVGGGKRIRAVLCVLIHDITGGDSRRSAIDGGCAIECLHAYTLIHDDLPMMDDDDMRRGKPSTHIAFGEPVALLAGDALQSLAFGVLAGLEAIPGERVREAVGILAEASGSTMLVGGQVADIEGEGGIPDPETVEFIHSRKTAALIAASMAIGAVLGGAKEHIVGKVRQSGFKAGLAFQIVDDILDIEGEEATAGKGLRKDSKKGKITWPSCFGLEESRKKAHGLVEESIALTRSIGDDGRVGSVLRMITDRVS